VTPIALERLSVLELRTFGGLALRFPPQHDPHPLQAQSKRLALLAYLALATPRGFHRRDVLLAMFWPESDESHARQALRQALYVLRNELGEGVVVNRGEDEIGLNWEAVWCDANAFDQAVKVGDYERALDIYQGDLLPGLHVAGAPDFARFLDDERARYRREAAAAAWGLAVRSGETEDAVSAVRWARRAVAIEPLEEERLRTVITRLDELGDRTAAIGLFEDFSRRLADEYQLEPAPETLDLVASVRARSRATQPATLPPSRSVSPPPHEPAVGESSTSRFPPRRSMVAIAGASVVVAGLALSWIVIGSLRRSAGAGSAEVLRIAVLPLENVGAQEDEWFADGMTDEITTRLANVGGLAVIARQSTVQYKGSTKPAGEIAEELDADYLLEGTVQTIHAEGGPGEVRIRPQLIRASDETHVWADTFTAPLLASEMFRMQTAVADHVARALDVTIRESERGDLEPVPTSNTEAYEFFLRGREYVAGAVPEQDLRIAVQMYERAVELDPGFAVAYAALAEAHLHLWWRFYDRRAERLASARAALDRALALDSLLPEAQIARGYYYYWGLLNYDAALGAFEVARASRPYSADLLYGIGSVQRRQGRLDEALTNLFGAAEANPRSALIARDIANTYAFMRNRVEAERYFHRAITLDPGWPTYVRDALRAHLRLDGSLADARRVIEEARSLGLEHPLLTTLSTWIEISGGNYDAALDLLSTMPVDAVESNSFFVPRAQLYAEVYDLLGNEVLRRAYYDSSTILVAARLQQSPDDARLRSALGIAYAGLGRKADAVREGERAVALVPIAEDAWHGVYRVESLAVIYALLGEDEQAIELLEYLLSIPGTLTVPFLKIDYRFNSLRDNPRFQGMLERYD
jgi:TolB-like protein/DNA-binding SARP family transcriptional activator/Tfp pilus assembly protein PilF